MGINDIDIYRAANILVEQHGPANALLEADKKLQRMKDLQDCPGMSIWSRIKDTIIELNDLDPTGHIIQ